MTIFHPACRVVILIAWVSFVPFVRGGQPAEKSVQAPDGLRVAVKAIGPVNETTDLQILCVLRHNASGDQYIEAMKDFNDRLGGLLSNLRSRGELAGEQGETFLFTPPPHSIAPAKVLLIGVGDESALTVDSLGLAGRIAAREAARLNAKHVAFAPTLRDQGSVRIDVAEGDAAVVEQFLLAYDTEKRLQAEGLCPGGQIDSLTIEAGPKYFDAVTKSVTSAIASAAQQIQKRDAAPYHDLAPAPSR